MKGLLRAQNLQLVIDNLPSPWLTGWSNPHNLTWAYWERVLWAILTIWIWIFFLPLKKNVCYFRGPQPHKWGAENFSFVTLLNIETYSPEYFHPHCHSRAATVKHGMNPCDSKSAHLLPLGLCMCKEYSNNPLPWFLCHFTHLSAKALNK